jgi:hypothetical protein
MQIRFIKHVSLIKRCHIINANSANSGLNVTELSVTLTGLLRTRQTRIKLHTARISSLDTSRELSTNFSTFLNFVREKYGDTCPGRSKGAKGVLETN